MQINVNHSDIIYSKGNMCWDLCKLKPWDTGQGLVGNQCIYVKIIKIIISYIENVSPLPDQI